MTGTVRLDRDRVESYAPEQTENAAWDESQEPAEETAEEGPEVGQLTVDMYETDNELVIQSMIAGVTPEHLNITVNRDSVIIKGKRIEPHGIGDDQYLVRELYWGEFERVIDLPFEVNTEGAEAVEKYGLLIIRLPRIDSQKTQKLHVKSI